jgi:hypothetical protein
MMSGRCGASVTRPHCGLDVSAQTHCGMPGMLRRQCRGQCGASVAGCMRRQSQTYAAPVSQHAAPVVADVLMCLGSLSG